MAPSLSRLHTMPVAVLDIGTTKITCWVVRAHEKNGFEVVGSAYQESRGYKSGQILDLSALVARLSSVMEKAEKLASSRVRYAVISISGPFLKGTRRFSEISLLGNYVTKEDIERLKDEARFAANPKENYVLHVLPQEYRLDAQGGVENPLGMLGQKLGGSFYIVSIPKVHVQNLLMALSKVHLDVLYAVAAPHATGMACLSQDEKRLGCVVLDIGGGGVSIAGYKNNALSFIDYVPIGGDHITKDLAYGLEVDLAFAERLKILQGSCVRGNTAAQLSFIKTQDATLHHQALSDERLLDIICPRVDEILTLVKQKLEEIPYFKAPALRFVVTGGGSQLVGLKEAMNHFFSASVRMADPHMPDGISEKRPDFATIAGIVKDMCEKERQSLAQMFSDSLKTKSFFRQIMTWFKENL